MLDTAHESTFEWIYKSPDDLKATRLREAMCHPCLDWEWLKATTLRQAKWHSFSDWLKAPDPSGPYWINGKPGSGKSMLMRFIEDRDDTLEILERDGMQDKAHILSYYFWLAGSSPLQNTIEGLLRSLLFQAIEQRAVDVNHLRTPDGPFEWSKRLGQKTLDKVLSQQDKRWLLLVDGLDEAADDIEELKGFLCNIGKLPRVKLVVSSRPLRAFEVYFHDSPSLRLQDLTDEDVRLYVRNIIESSSVVSNYLSAEDLRYLISEIARKSEGVFFWTKLAMNSITEGIEHLESLEQLKARLCELPTDINDMFEAMVHKMKPQYLGQILIYIRMMLVAKSDGRDLSLVEVSVAHLIRFTSSQPTNIPLTLSSILGHCDHVRVNVKSKCAGFVEIADRDKGSVLVFIHRTALDFLRGYVEGTREGFAVQETLRLLTNIHIELVRFASDDLEVLHAVRRRCVFECIRRLVPNAPKDILNIWQRLNASGSAFIHSFNSRTGLSEAVELWPCVLDHLNEMYLVGLMSSSTLEHSDDIITKLHSYAERYGRFSYPGPMTILGEAASTLHTEVLQNALVGVSRLDATYMAFCGLSDFVYTSTHQGENLDIYRPSVAHGAYYDMVSMCLNAGADTAMEAEGFLKQKSPSYIEALPFEEGELSSSPLLNSFLGSAWYWTVHGPIFLDRENRKQHELLAILKLLCTHGADLNDLWFTYTLGNCEDEDSWANTELEFELNVSAQFCQQASYTDGWADVANFIWSACPRIKIRFLHAFFGPKCRTDVGGFQGRLSLENARGKIDSLGGFEPMVNETQTSWCPYIPSDKAVESYKECVKQTVELFRRNFQEVAERIMSGDDASRGGKWVKYGYESEYVVYIEHEGMLWEWISSEGPYSNTMTHDSSSQCSEDSDETFYSVEAACTTLGPPSADTEGALDSHAHQYEAVEVENESTQRLQGE